MENMPELYDIEEISDDKFPLSFSLIQCYYQEETILTGKINSEEYQTGYFLGGRNTINNYKVQI